MIVLFIFNSRIDLVFYTKSDVFTKLFGEKKKKKFKYTENFKPLLRPKTMRN